MDFREPRDYVRVILQTEVNLYFDLYIQFQMARRAIVSRSTVTLTVVERSAEPRKRGRFRLTVSVLALGVILCTLTVVAVIKWPFTKQKITRELEAATAAAVHIQGFHSTFLPPGCVAENVSIDHRGSISTGSAATIGTLRFLTSYPKLLERRVALIEAADLRVVTSKADFHMPQGIGNGTVIETFELDRGSIELRRASGMPLLFRVTQFTLQHPSQGSTLPFELQLRNPEPEGYLDLKGSFGPLDRQDQLRTPIAASYKFEHVNLGTAGGLSGILSSTGTVAGSIDQLNIQGAISIPDFATRHAGHELPTTLNYAAALNLNRGSIELTKVQARLGGSTVTATGAINDIKDPVELVTNDDLIVSNGRIQDFLFFLLKPSRPVMTGGFTFRGEARLPNGVKPFRERVELVGDFGIDAGRFTNPKTQQKIDRLSETAEGEPSDSPESVVSDLKGHVELKNGTFTFSALSFRAPGGVAKLHGTYSLITEQVNLRGKVFTNSSLPQETTGFKSFMLKLIGPFLKKNHHGGAVIPVSITGKYPHPTYKTDPI